MTTLLIDPVYLDEDMLATLATRFGMDVSDVEVTRRTNRARKRSARGSVGGFGGERGSGDEDEWTEHTSESFDPLHTLAQVVDRLDGEGLPDASGATDEVARQGALVEVEGELVLSPLTPTARIMSFMLPQLMQQATTGQDNFELDESQALRDFMSGELAMDVTAILELPEAEQRVVVLARPGGIVDRLEDLEDDLRVIGTAHRVVRPNRTRSLAPYVLPGLSRDARKAIGDDGVVDLISRLPEGFIHWDGEVEDAVIVEGPAIIIKPLVIY